MKLRRIHFEILLVVLVATGAFIVRAVDGSYPILARNTDGYSVIDLSTVKADTVGNLNGRHMKLESLEVTTSVTLPSSGSVPNHTIETNHNTNATGAQLNTLVGGGAADTLHSHTAVSAHTIETNHNTNATGAQLNTLVGGVASDARFLHTHTNLVDLGVGQRSEYFHMLMDDNAANSTVLDLSGKMSGSAYSNSVLVNTSTISTTTAVLGGRALYLSGYAAGREQINNYAPLAEQGRDFTVSFWHKPRKTGLGVTEYPMHASSNFYLSLSSIGRYFCYMAPTGGTAFYVSTSPTNYYNTGFHLIVFGRRGTTFFFYVDGKLIGSATNSGNDGNIVGSGIRFGGALSATMGRGVVDDTRVYRYMLSAAEISALYNAGSGTSAPVKFTTDIDGALSLQSRSGYVAEMRNVGNSTAYKGIKVLAGENTASANNEMIGCYEGDGDQRGALVIDSSRNVAIWNVSDKEAKKNIAQVKSKMAALKAVKVYEYEYKTGGKANTGFLAQELEVAVPAASAELEVDENQTTRTMLGAILDDNGTTLTLTTGEKIPRASVDIEGQNAVKYSNKVVKVKRKGVVTTELIPVLWKIVQEQQAQIESLEARMKSLQK